MTRILVVSLSNLASDPRLDRQIDFVRQHYEVVTAGFAPSAWPELEHHQLDVVPHPPRRIVLKNLATGVAWRLLLRHERALWNNRNLRRWRDDLRHVEADLIVINDAIMLPVGFAVARGRPVVFDAHEYAPREGASLLWRLAMGPIARWACNTFIPRTAGFLTVAPGIADQYERDTGRRPVVVTNAPHEQALAPTATGEEVRMIHFGGAARQRRLELMIDTVRLLDERFSLDFMLVGGEDYVAELKERAAPDRRIRFLDPVPMRDLVRVAHAYDIGLYPLPPATFNERHALPNKFFEFIQARLAVAIGPSPEMKHIVEEWGCGIVAADFTANAVADALRSLSAADIDAMKRGADAAARELTAERNRELVLEVVERALASQST